MTHHPLDSSNAKKVTDPSGIVDRRTLPTPVDGAVKLQCYLCNHEHKNLCDQEAKFILNNLKTCEKHSDEMKALMGREPGEEG